MIKTSIAAIATLFSNAVASDIYLTNNLYLTRTPEQLSQMADTGEAFQA